MVEFLLIMKQHHLFNRPLLIKLIASAALGLALFMNAGITFAAGTTFIVDSTADTGDINLNGICDNGSGECTLRAAIDESNATADLDTINFSLSPNSTITSASTFVITSPIAIDATSITTCPTPGIIIDGSGTSGDVFRLSNNAAGSSIKGLIIKNYQTTTGVGIRLSAVSGSTTTIACNIIGLNEDGTTASGGTSGIVLTSSSNVVIGGSTVADRNIISGNRTVSSSSGIAISGASYSDITIRGNYIGTNPGGTAVNRNTSKGIGFSGATTIISNITISHNLFAGKGIAFDNNVGINGVTIQANTFNLSSDGTTALAPVSNQVSAISFSNNTDAQNIQIGGSSLLGLGNIFATYPVVGSVIATNTTGISMQGNLIGTGESNESFPSTYGIILGGTSTGALIGGTGNGEGNTITNMTTTGIMLIGSNLGSPLAALLGNSIYNNAGNGIDLNYDQDNNQMPDTDVGVSLNDLYDADTGSNNYLNRPTIVSATQVGSDVETTYILDVPVSTYPYRVEFFSNSGVTSSTHFGEGKTYVGSVQQDITSAGQHIFTTILDTVSASDVITATVSSCNNVGCTEFVATSEFSNGSTTGVDRGNSESTETLFENNGAYHFIKSGVSLGASVIADSATGADGSDRDGVTFDSTTYLPSSTSTITVVASEAGYLSAWIDADNNGTFESELFSTNQSLVSGDNTFSFIVPATDGVYPVRFRYTDYSVTTPSPLGEALNGEVEDYDLVVASPVAEVVVIQSTGRLSQSTFTPSTQSTPTSSPNAIIGSGTCSAALTVKDSMRLGDKNGNYSTYNKGVVRDVKILQSHINRILAAQYNQAAGPVDGIFGKQTKRGVERLQTVLNTTLKPVPSLSIDGIVGPYTRTAINNSCGK